MNVKREIEPRGADTLKLLAAIVLLVAAAMGYFMLDQYVLWMRLAGLLLTAVLAVFIASRTAVGRRFLGFIGLVNAEVRKVVWPSRQETIQTTLVVMMIVIIMGIFMWAVDALFGFGMAYIMNRGS